MLGALIVANYYLASTFFVAQLERLIPSGRPQTTYQRNYWFYADPIESDFSPLDDVDIVVELIELFRLCGHRGKMRKKVLPTIKSL